LSAEAEEDFFFAQAQVAAAAKMKTLSPPAAGQSDEEFFSLSVRVGTLGKWATVAGASQREHDGERAGEVCVQEDVASGAYNFRDM
jgi:hypothetical protein